MNVRPIHSLEEDFSELGVLDEAGMDPMQRKAARAQQQFAKKQARKKMQFQKQQQKKYGSTPQMSDFDYDDEFIDEDDLDESSVKLHRGTSRARIQAKKAYRKKRGLLKRIMKRMRHSGIYKRMMAKRKKMGRVTKGRRRVFKGPSIMKRLGLSTARRGSKREDVDDIASVVESLRYDTNIGQLGSAFQEVALFSRDIADGFEELSEDFVSTQMDYGDLGVACHDISEEAMDFATAIQDHGDDLPPQDVDLLMSHLVSLAEEIDNLHEMFDVNAVAIAITEGTLDALMEDDEDDEPYGEEDLVFLDENDVEELLASGVEIMDEDEFAEEYGEQDLNYEYGHGNDSDTKTFDVMNPLGISRAGQREKLILQKQLRRETTEDFDLDY